MAEIITLCERCNLEHSWSITEEDINKGLTFNFGCLNIKRLPKVTSFRIDTTGNANQFDPNYARTIITHKYGIEDLEDKIVRWKEINSSRLWLIHDFDPYVEEMIQTYIAGNFYPVASACTTLAERIANLLILKLKNSYNQELLDSENKKYVYSRDQSWQNHDRSMEVLETWGVLSGEQKKLFTNLYKIRSRSVHFQTDFDAKKDASDAIKSLHELIDSYFNQMKRTDLMRVFEIPGEIWVREEKINDPFVKAFVLPNCNDFASCGFINNQKEYHELHAIPGNFSEQEFIDQRIEYSKYPSNIFQEALDHSPIYKAYALEDGRLVSYRLI